jgi:hypothetical protein
LVFAINQSTNQLNNYEAGKFAGTFATQSAKKTHQILKKSHRFGLVMTIAKM